MPDTPPHTGRPAWPRPWAVLAALVVLAASATPAAGQYFGRNKVQYETFDFQVLQTEHFDIYYYPEMREAALVAGRMAERWYSRLSRLLGHELGSRQPLIMYANHPHFEQTNALSGELGESTGGVTEVFKRRMVLPFAAGLKDTDHVIGHEMVHAFQFDITGQGGSVQTGQIPGALRLPLWFIEGMAEYLTQGADDPHTAMWMRDQSRRTLPTIPQLGDSYRWFPYRYGQAVWAYLAGRYGDEIVSRLLQTAGRSNDPELAMARILGADLMELSEQWHRAVTEAYAPLVEVTDPPSTYGEQVFANEGTLNTAPTISPDGRRLAFISSRDLFSLDVFIGDLETGKILRKLTQTATDPHFESLQFISSAGAFSADGERFVLAGVSRGRPTLTIIEVESGDHVRDIRLPELGEVFTPTWSPDGRYVAFSALVGGFSDLFMYDLERGELRRLTNDPFGDLQPTWSPDGRSLAFVTDRFTTDVARLEYGEYRVAVMDIASGQTTPAPGFPTGKQMSPQWAPDGEHLYFVSDQNGVSNVYQVRLDDGTLRQVSNLYTGVTGITPTSPALTVAATGDRAVMSVFVDGGTALYLVKDPAVLQGKDVLPPFASARPSQLPPADPIADQITATLTDFRTGLPDTAEFLSKRYGPGLRLDYVAQPQLVVGASSYGTYIGAGAALYWSDMLGNRNLTTALQVNGSIKDVSGIVAYTNLRRRLNWGAFLQQVTYLASAYGWSIIEVDGRQVAVEVTDLFRQTNRELSGLVAYPFNRAQRLELTAGVRDIRFDAERKTVFSDPFTGERLDDVSEDIPTGLPSITSAVGSAALVYDQSLYGATGPILGQRYRLEVSPSLGDLNYVGVLADFRRYVIPLRPFTIAGRLMHFGRYGGDSDTTIIQPINLGYPGMVRGYDYNSFEPQDCVPDPAFPDDPDTCPLYSQLTGSRMVMANLELRFPLLGALGVGGGYYGVLPVELAIFSDEGVAYWGGDLAYTGPDDRAWFLGGDRRPLVSAGAGLRVNLLGFAIIEVDFAHAFQRNRWVWQFGFVPGF
jgi:Tol biopolymer transport system component